MILNQEIVPILEQLRPQIDQILLLLTQKEKHVIERRYNLDEKSRATLEEIGQEYQITRERVRQIENNALQKLRRNIENTQLYAINKVVYNFLIQNGGLMREDLLLAEMINTNNVFSTAALQLVLSLDKRFIRTPNTVQFHPYVRVITFPAEIVNRLTEASISFLESNGKTVKVAELVNFLKMNIEEKQFVAPETLTSLYKISKNFKLLQGDVGLIQWRNINPRTIRDKIYFVLRQNKKPLHFVDISNAIVAARFDQKTLNIQAIHNELIRYDEFILVGRGIYALKEWGFSVGTVGEIIESVLKKHESLSQDEIIAEVLKQRQVKPITIILNLKNKKRFVRVGRSQYSLAEAV